MSTSYYRLAPPTTHIRVEETPGHARLTLFINHAMSGTLIVRQDEMKETVRLFQLYEDDDQCPLRTHWGGKDRGTVVTVNDETLPEEAVVISEYGELLTVAQVKARDGAKRADGFPTELFGYEDRFETKNASVA